MPLAYVPILHRWQEDGHHFLLIRRSITDPQEMRYSFVFAPAGTTLQEMVQASGARWHIEEDFANAKDMGLDQYEVVRRESRASNCSIRQIRRKGTCCSTSSILEQQSGMVTSREKPADNDPQP